MNTDTAIMEPKSNKITAIAEKINSGLAAFENRKSELLELKSQAEGLQITSIEDKQSINQVVSIRKKLKNARVQIEKEGKLMRDPLTIISREISAKEKELVSIIEPTEKTLLKQEQWVEDEKERIQKEIEEKERQRIQNRIDRLSQYGYSIDYNFLTSLPDDQFDQVVENARVEYEKERARIAEEERLRLEAEEKVRLEREAEDARLKAEREELERMRKNQEERERQIQQEQKAILKEQEKLRLQKIEKRHQDLFRLGFKRIDGGFAYHDFSITDEGIEEPTDGAWESEISKVLPNSIRMVDEMIQERKAREEKAEKERIEKLQREAAEKALREKEEADRRKKEEEAEKLRLASDKVKFQDLYNQLKLINIPEMKSAKSRKIAEQVADIITNAQQHIINNVIGEPKNRVA